jgi:hypothetical protein
LYAKIGFVKYLIICLLCGLLGFFFLAARAAAVQCPRHPSTGPFGGASAVLKIWVNVQTRFAQTSTLPDPNFSVLRARCSDWVAQALHRSIALSRGWGFAQSG